MKNTNRYRVNPSLAVTPLSESDSNAAFAIENIEEQERFPISDVQIVEMLDIARDWTPLYELECSIGEAFDVDDDAATDLVAEFIEHGFLIKEGSTPQYVDDGENWFRYNWEEALEFYRYLRNYPFVDYGKGQEAFEEDFGRMQRYAESEDIPPNHKDYKETEQLSLPTVHESSTLPPIDEVLGFTEQPCRAERVDRETLASLLYFTFGATGTVSFPHQGEFLLKTSPSGGARHPTEAYVAIFDVTGIPEGLYHYSVRDHALDVLETGAIESAVRDAIFELDMHTSFNVSLVVVLSSVVERSMWRYREPRSYTVVQNDIGHLLETLRLVCNANGLETTFGHGFDDTSLSDLFDLDPFAEPIFKHAPIGTL